MKTYEIIAKIERKNLFDIFGIFEKSVDLDHAHQIEVANKIGAEYAKKHHPGQPFHIVGFAPQNGKLKVTVRIG